MPVHAITLATDGTHLSTGSTACWRKTSQNGSLTRNCTELPPIPKERIACYALRANWSARDDLHVQGCPILTQVGLLFPVNHAPMKMASLTGFAPVISCMRGRHVDWTTPQGRNGESRRNCAFDLVHVTHPLWLTELCPRNG